jgi:hypothetical protein
MIGLRTGATPNDHKLAIAPEASNTVKLRRSKS